MTFTSPGKANNMLRIIFDALAIGSFVTVLLITLAPARAETAAPTGATPTTAKCDTDSACALYDRKAKRAKTLTGVHAFHDNKEAPSGYHFCTYSKGQPLRLCATPKTRNAAR